MNDKDIENMGVRLNLMSNVMVEMFKVVAAHIPATNGHFADIVKRWETIEDQFPISQDEME